MEKGIKDKTSQLFQKPPLPKKFRSNSVSSGISHFRTSSFSRNAPYPSPTIVIVEPRDASMNSNTWPYPKNLSAEGFIDREAIENSVEEPNRYAERLLDFLDTVIE